MTPLPTAVKERALAVNGLEFQALSARPGIEAAGSRELVLLLHGFPQFADAWTPLLEALAGAGYHAVAVDQRGYSPGARPMEVGAYALEHLLRDVFGFADAFGAQRFHVVGHDWGGLLAWAAAAQRPDRLHSVSVLATPHVDAFLDAIHTDPDQMWKSKYIPLFKMPGHVAESLLLGDDGKRLRAVYQGKVPEAQVERNVRRMRDGDCLTAALNWYRALELSTRIGVVSVPALYVWGDKDIALGETAALTTAQHVSGPYRFERMGGVSHWLVEERPAEIARLVLDRVAKM